MLRAAFYLILLLATALLAGYFSAYPGEVTLSWQEWRADTSVAVLLLLIFLLALAVMSVLLCLRFFLLLPRRFRRGQRERRYMQGLKHVTESLVALAGGELDAARRATHQAERRLGQDAPAVLLLTAQIAKLEGNDARARQMLEQMLKHKETEYLAARGLSDYHTRQQQASFALAYAEQALTLRPKDPRAVRGAVASYMRLSRHAEALNALSRARWRIPRAERRRSEGLVMLLKAQSLKEAADIPGALHAAEEAVKRLRGGPVAGFAQAGALSATLAQVLHGPKDAQRRLRRAFAHSPHPLLADAFRAVAADELPTRALKLAQSLAATQSAHLESRLLVAEAALAASAHDIARAELKAALEGGDEPRACNLMARLEKSAYNDEEAAERWRLRALAAEAARTRHACSECHYTSSVWSALCPECGAFDCMK